MGIPQSSSSISMGLSLKWMIPSSELLGVPPCSELESLISQEIIPERAIESENPCGTAVYLAVEECLLTISRRILRQQADIDIYIYILRMFVEPRQLRNSVVKFICGICPSISWSFLEMNHGICGAQETSRKDCPLLNYHQQVGSIHSLIFHVPICSKKNSSARNIGICTWFDLIKPY